MYKLTPAVYIWTHGYLNTIQVGVQSAHVVAELFVNYPEEISMVHEWAINHKTLRLLNAGTGEVFINRFEEFKLVCAQNRLEHAWFREPDFYNQITAFGLVLDTGAIYNIETLRESKHNMYMDYNDPRMDDFPLVQLLKSCPSAK